MKYLMTGLHINVTRCAELLDHTLISFNELAGIPDKIVEWNLKGGNTQVTSPSFCTTASERAYITTSSGKDANGGSQGAVGDRRAAICGANAAGAGGL